MIMIIIIIIIIIITTTTIIIIILIIIMITTIISITRTDKIATAQETTNFFTCLLCEHCIFCKTKQGRFF